MHISINTLGVDRVKMRLFFRSLWVKSILENILGKACNNIFFIFFYAKIVTFDN